MEDVEVEISSVLEAKELSTFEADSVADSVADAIAEVAPVLEGIKDSSLDQVEI